MKINPQVQIDNEQEFVKLLLQNNSTAQKLLYEKFSPKMLSVCRSYIPDFHAAEDCMIKAFVKIFRNISSFKGVGSLEGWMRKIMVNECLDNLKSTRKIYYLDEEYQDNFSDLDNEFYDFDVQELLDALPENYRIVFNLFVLEDYSHKEISDLLHISEPTCRQQLKRAKAKLKELYLINNKTQNEIKV